MASFVVSAVILGLGIGMIEPTIASETLRRTPEALHDRAMGVNLAALFLGQFLNPVAMGPLREAWGIRAAFLIVGGAYLVGGLLFAAAVGGVSSASRPRPPRSTGR